MNFIEYTEQKESFKQNVNTVDENGEADNFRIATALIIGSLITRGSYALNDLIRS